MSFPQSPREPSHSRLPVDDLEPASEHEIDPALFEEVHRIVFPKAYRQAAQIQLAILERALLHILSNNHSPESFWQVCYGLGSARCEGHSEAERARMLGVKRATLSKGATAFRRACGLPPNQGKDVEAIHHFSESRLEQIPG